MLLHIFYALTCSALWAGVTIVGKLLSGSVSPIIIAFLRYGIAVACLIPFISRVDYNRVDRKNIISLIVLGLTIFLFNGLFFYALQFTSATTAALISSTNPILTLMISTLIIRQMPTKNQLLAIIFSLLGATMVITQGKFEYTALTGNFGEFVMLAAVFSQIAYTMALKRVSGHFSPLFLTFATGASGLIFFAPFLLNQTILDGIIAMNIAEWLMLGYVGLFGTAAAIILYSMSVHKLGPSMTSLLVFSSMPIFVFILSFLIVGDNISPWQTGGGLLVLCSLLIALRKN